MTACNPAGCTAWSSACWRRSVLLSRSWLGAILLVAGSGNGTCVLVFAVLGMHAHALQLSMCSMGYWQRLTCGRCGKARLRRQSQAATKASSGCCSATPAWLAQRMTRQANDCMWQLCCSLCVAWRRSIQHLILGLSVYAVWFCLSRCVMKGSASALGHCNHPH